MSTAIGIQKKQKDELINIDEMILAFIDGFIPDVGNYYEHTNTFSSFDDKYDWPWTKALFTLDVKARCAEFILRMSEEDCIEEKFYINYGQTFSNLQRLKLEGDYSINILFLNSDDTHKDNSVTVNLNQISQDEDVYFSAVKTFGYDLKNSNYKSTYQDFFKDEISQESSDQSKVRFIQLGNYQHMEIRKESIERKDDRNPLVELNAMIGLASVKDEIRAITNMLKVNVIKKKKGIKTPSIPLHLVFTGSPGTGKTTVARLIGKIYKDLGLLKNGHVIEVERADLCGVYIGQTADRTRSLIEAAMGGVLFIDEAYELSRSSSSNDYGHEAIAGLLKALEDHRDDFAVIVAGYEEPMRQFIDSNNGLQSRFSRYVKFQDFNPHEMLEIFDSLLVEYSYSLSFTARKKIEAVVSEMIANRNANFANARDIRNLFNKIVERQSSRFILENCNDEELLVIRSVDIPN